MQGGCPWRVIVTSQQATRTARGTSRQTPSSMQDQARKVTAGQGKKIKAPLFFSFDLSLQLTTRTIWSFIIYTGAYRFVLVISSPGVIYFLSNVNNKRMQRLRKWTQVNLFTEKYNITTRSRSRDITVWIYIVKFGHVLPLIFSAPPLKNKSLWQI